MRILERLFSGAGFLKSFATRRNMLTVLLALPPLYFLKRFLSPPVDNTAMYEIPLSELPENAVYMVRDKKIALIRFRGEINAISIACPHLGCTINVSGDQFLCPCHGSIFTLKGEVVRPPAVTNLTELRHEIDNDNVVKVYVR